MGVAIFFKNLIQNTASSVPFPMRELRHFAVAYFTTLLLAGCADLAREEMEAVVASDSTDPAVIEMESEVEDRLEDYLDNLSKGVINIEDLRFD